MVKLLNKALIAALVLSPVMAAPAMAATNGALSTSSSAGTVDFTAVIPSMVRISGLTDMTLNVTPDAVTSPYFSREDTESKFCVYSNIGADGGYTLKVDGTAGTTNPFALTNAATSAKLSYDVWVSDNVSNSFKNYTWPGNVVTGYKTTSGGQARPATLDCSDVGKNALVHVGINNTNILAATAGTYKGTLTITVSTI